MHAHPPHLSVSGRERVESAYAYELRINNMSYLDAASNIIAHAVGNSMSVGLLVASIHSSTEPNANETVTPFWLGVGYGTLNADQSSLVLADSLTDIQHSNGENRYQILGGLVAKSTGIDDFIKKNRRIYIRL